MQTSLILVAIVADNYHARLTRALGVASSALNLTAAYSGAAPAGLTFCPLLNISQCPATETGPDSLTVTLYNPLGRPVTEYVRLPVVAAQYEVVGPGGATLPAQLVQIPAQLAALPGRTSPATHSLVFRAEVGELGLAAYTVRQTGPALHSPARPTKQRKLLGGRTGGLQVWLEPGSSRLHLRDPRRGLQQELDMELLSYRAHRGNNSEFQFRASGAYIFRPDGEAVRLGEPRNTVITEGELVTEILRTYSEADWAIQVMKRVISPTQFT